MRGVKPYPAAKLEFVGPPKALSADGNPHADAAKKSILAKCEKEGEPRAGAKAIQKLGADNVGQHAKLVNNIAANPICVIDFYF